MKRNVKVFIGYKNINLISQVIRLKSVKEQIASSHEHRVSKQNIGENCKQWRGDKLPGPKALIQTYESSRSKYAIHTYLERIKSNNLH